MTTAMPIIVSTELWNGLPSGDKVSAPSEIAYSVDRAEGTVHFSFKLRMPIPTPCKIEWCSIGGVVAEGLVTRCVGSDLYEVTLRKRDPDALWPWEAVICGTLNSEKDPYKVLVRTTGIADFRWRLDWGAWE